MKIKSLHVLLPLFMAITPIVALAEQQLHALTQKPIDQLILVPKTWGPTDRLIKRIGDHPYLSSALIAISGIALLGATIYDLNKMESLQNQLLKRASQNTELERLNNQIEQQNQQIEDLNKKIKETEQGKETTHEEATKLQDRIQELEKEKEKLSEENAAKLEEIKTQLAETQKTLGEKTELLQKQEKVARELQQQQQKAAQQLNEKELEIKQLALNLENSKKLYKQLKSEQQQAIDQLQQKITKLEEQNTLDLSILQAPDNQESLGNKLIEQNTKINQQKGQIEQQVEALEKLTVEKDLAAELIKYFASPNFNALQPSEDELYRNLQSVSTCEERIKKLEDYSDFYYWAKQFNQLLTYAAEITLLPKGQADAIWTTAWQTSKNFIVLYEELLQFNESTGDLSKSVMLSGLTTSPELQELQGQTVGWKRLMYHIKLYGEKYLRRTNGPNYKKELNKEEQQIRMAYIAETIFKNIQKGAVLWKDLSDETKELKDQEITQLLWYMYYQGLLTSPVRTGPEEFSFVLTEKNKGKILFDLLSARNNKYTRMASHLQAKEGFSEQEIYGLDIWSTQQNPLFWQDNAQLFLPVGMRTLLFMKAEQEGRTFYLFKPEKYSSKDLVNHGADFVFAQTWKWLAKAGLAHSHDDALEYNKERIPKHILDVCKKQSKDPRPIFVLKNKLSENSKQGQYINQFYEHHENLEDRVGNEIPINTLANETAEYYAKIVGKQIKFDDSDKAELEQQYQLRRLKTLHAIGSYEKTLKQDPVTWHNEVVKELYPENYGQFIKTNNRKAQTEIQSPFLLKELKSKIEELAELKNPNTNNALDASVFGS